MPQCSPRAQIKVSPAGILSWRSKGTTHFQGHLVCCQNSIPCHWKTASWLAWGASSLAARGHADSRGHHFPRSLTPFQPVTGNEYLSSFASHWLPHPPHLSSCPVSPHLVDSSQRNISAFKGPSDHVGPIWKSQDNLPILKSADFIAPAKPH